MTDETLTPMMACGHAANAVNGDGNPSCVICAGSPEAETIVATPDLTGRMAKCACGRLAPSQPGVLAFFEFRGEGSESAVKSCAVCGFHLCAHDPVEMQRRVDKRTVVEMGACTGFVARGPWDTDLYYCGCRGWD